MGTTPAAEVSLIVLTFVWSTPADTTPRKEYDRQVFAFGTQHQNSALQNSTLQAAQIVCMPTSTDDTLLDLEWCLG